MNKILKQVGVDTGYLLSSFPIAIPAFVAAVAGFAAGVGTVVVWIGVPILAATLVSMRGFAAAGRAQLPAVLGTPIPTVHYRQAPEGSSTLRRVLTPVADGQSWLNLLWAVVNFPVAVAGFAVALSWWVATVASLTYPLYGWIIRRAVGSDDGLDYATEWLGWGDTYMAVSALAFAGGLIMALMLPLILRGCALTQGWLGRGLLASLSGPGERQGHLEARVKELDDELARVRNQLTDV